MQPPSLLLLLLIFSFRVILTRGEAWPEVKGWGHISLGEMLGEVREESQVLKGFKGHWREEILFPQMGTTYREC